MRNKLRKGLALLMAILMFISCAPMDALAAIIPVSGGTQTSSGVSLQSIVKPPVATATYIFKNGDAEFARQILKNGETLNNPGTPVADSDNKEFVGWFDESGNQLTFPYTAAVTETGTITINARFEDVYFVFFTNEKGEVMVTKKGHKGDTITTDGVTYPVGNEETIVGWQDESGKEVSSVTLENKDITLMAIVTAGHWITYDSQQGSYVEPAFVKGDSTTTAPEPPTRPGYTFDHWSETVNGAAFTFGARLDKALTLYAVWTPNKNTQYTVIHWQENANDDDYSYAESETKTGTTGAATSATAKSYSGFTAQTITQETIKGDGSTIVNVYYKRDVYTISFYREHKHTYERRTGSYWSYTYYGGCYPTNGGTTAICGMQAGSWYVVHTIEAKWDANVTKQWPTNINGTTDWRTTESGDQYQVSIDRMPKQNKKYYDPYTEENEESDRETASYYVETLPGEAAATTYNGKSYKLDHQDVSAGSGFIVTDDDKYAITGFTFVGFEANRSGRNYSYNGAKFYYTRNSYNIIFINNGTEVNRQSKLYQENISNAGTYVPEKPSTLPDSYTFAGWFVDPTGEQEYSFSGTMPAQNITVYAKWEAPTSVATAFTTIIGGSSETIDPIPYGGTITDRLNELQATIMADHPGYTWRGWRTAANGEGEPFHVETKIYSDITLYPYYTKDGTFSVTYVSGKADVTAPTDSKAYAEDSYADLMTPDKLVSDDGQYFLGWTDGTNTYQPRDKYQIKDNVTFTAVWGARLAKVSLTYKANGGTGNDVTEAYDNNETVTTISNPFTRAGYTFAGWDTNASASTGSIKENEQVQVDSVGENILYAIWTANTDTKYTVEFYYQNTDGSYTLNHSDERKSTTDTTVSVTDADKADKENGKYVFETDNANNVLSGTIAGAGTLVLKLYFKLNTAEYTIHHYLKGTDVKVADDQTGSMTIGEALTAVKSTALYTEYAEATVDSYAPSESITIVADASKNVITVYYTVPLTLKAADASKIYDGQPLTQPDFTADGLVNGDTKAAITLSMIDASAITDVGTTDNVIDQTTVSGIPSYYTVSYDKGTLTVTPVTAKVTVTITENSDSVTYDGNEHSIKGYASMVSDNDLYDVTDSVKMAATDAWTAKGTDAGEYPVGIVAGDFKNTNNNFTNVEFVIVDGALTINPVTDEVVVTVKENSDTVTYDGSEHSVTGYESMTADNRLYDVKTSVKETETAAWTAKGTNVGTYPVGIVAGDFENTNKNFTNVRFVIVDGELVITNAHIEATFTGDSDTKVYNGSEQSITGITASGLLTGHTYEGLTYIAKGTYAGEYDGGFDGTVVIRDANGVDVTENYSINKNPGKLTITPVTDKVTVTITEKSDSVTYDGDEHSITGYASMVSDNELYDAATSVWGEETEAWTAKGTDAGEYPVGIVAGDFTNTNPNFTNVEFVIVDGTLTINPVTDKVTVTITENSAEHTYDGNEHSIKGYASMVSDNDLYDVTTSVKATETDAWTAKGTDAGEYPVGIVKTDFANTNKNFTNVEFVIVDGTLKINPITDKVTVTITENSDSVTYDGKEHSVKGYKSMTADNTLYDVTTSVKATETDAWTAKGTNAGEYPVGIVKTDFANTNKNFTNVEFVIVDGTLKINPITDKVTVTITEANKTVTYNGSEHSVSGYTFIEADNPLYNLDKVAETRTDAWTAKGTDAGEYPVGIVAGDFKNNDTNFTNVEFVIVDGKLTINPITEKTITITANSETKVYDGTPLTDNGYTFTQGVLVNGDVLTAVVEGSQTDAGSSSNTVTSYKVMRGDKDVTGNYTFGESVKGTLTVSPRPVTITAQDYTVEYDGQPHGKNPATPYAVKPAADNSGLVSGHTESNVNIAFTATDADTYDDMLAIDKAAVTITDSSNNDVTGNYAITVVPGTLTIEQYKGEVIVTITGNTQLFTYDCTEHTVQGFTAEVNNPLYNVNTDFTYDGNLYEAATLLAVVKGTNVGVYRMNLSSNHCVNLNKNFAEVTFRVHDGSLAIEKQNLVIEVANSSKVYGNADPAFADATFLFYDKTGATIEPSADMKKELSAIDLTVHRADAGDDTIGTHVDVLTISKTAEELREIYTNYNIGVNYGDFEITSTEESLKVKADNYEGAYDGNGHGVVAKAYINGTTEAPNAVIRYYNEDTGKFDLTESPKFTDVKSDSRDDRIYTVRFQATLDGLTAEGSANVLISPRKIVLSSGTESKDYDGLPLTSEAAVVRDGLIIKGQIYDLKATGSVTTVAEGIVENTITYSTTDEFKAVNYDIVPEPGKLHIEKRDVNLTSETASKEYDGTPLTRTHVSVGRNGFVKGEVTDLRAIGSVTYVDEGEVTNTITFTPTDKFDENNYNITKQEGKLSITARSGENKTITITTATNSKVYDGTALTDYNHTWTGELVTGDTLVVTYLNSSARTNAGSCKNEIAGYRVVRNVDGADKDVTSSYTFGETIIGTLTVTPRDIELTANSDSKQYDGTALTNDGYTITKGAFVGDEGLASVTVEGSQTEVGSSDNTITGHTLKANTLSDNYTITYNKGTLTVSASTKELKITANSNTWTYDGQQHADGGYTVTYGDETYTVKAGESATLSTGDKVTAVIEKQVKLVSDTKAGNNEIVTLTIENANQYANVVTEAGTLTITQKPLTITADSDAKEYDGTPLTKNSYTNSALADGDKIESVTITGSITQVGSVDNVPSAAVIKAGSEDVTANYDITYVPGKLTISASTKELKVIANSNSWQYDGQQHADGGYTVTYGDESYTVNAGESATLSTGDKVTAVITKQVKNVSDTAANNNEIVTLTIENADQYTNVEQKAGTLTITQKPLTITADSDAKVYDGTPLTKNSYTNSALADGDKIESVTITGSITKVGSVDNVASAAVIKAGSEDVTANYDITYAPGKLTISASEKKLTVTANSHSWMYDGQQHADGGYTVTYGNESYTVNAGESATLSTGDKVTAVITKQVKNVSDTAANNNEIVTLTIENADQYTNVEQNAGTLTITKRSVTLTSESGSKEYDGTPLTKPDVSVTGDGFADDEASNITATGSVTYVDEGEVTNTITFTPTDKFDENNYSITKVEGKLSITARSGENKTITITTATRTELYDGTVLMDHNHTWTGELVTGDTLIVTYPDTSAQKDAGSCPNAIDGYRVVRNVDGADKDVTSSYTFGETSIGTLTVTPRKVTLTSEGGSKEYDGTPLTKHDVTVTGDGFVDGEVSNITATGSVTYVSEGMVDNTITYTKGANFKDGNYEITEKVGQLYITKRGSGEAKVIIQAKDNTVKYDGQLHGAVLNADGQIEENTSFTVANLAAGHKVASVEIDADGGRKYVGTYTNLLVPKNAKIVDQNNKDVTDNYDITYQPGTLTIQKRDAMVTITGPSAEREYTGQEQQITTDAIVYGKNTENGEMNVTGMLEEDNIQVGSVKHVVKGTYVGRYEGTFTFEGAHANDTVPTPTVLNNGYDVTENYNFIYVPGYLTITSDHPTQPDKEITGHTAGTKYDLGDHIAFTITVRNITNAELKNVEVSDPTAVIVAGTGYKVVDEHHALIETMAASTGATPTTVVINAYHVVTEDDIRKAVAEDSFKYENVATIKVDNKTIDAKTGTNDIEDPDLTLKLDKKLVNSPAAGDAFKLGETAEFEITVTNVGNVTQTQIPVSEALEGAVFEPGEGYTLNADKTVATIAKLAPAPGRTQGESIVLKAKYTITEEDLGNKELKNIATAPNAEPGEEPIPVDDAKSISGQKIWDDQDNRYNTRTESITLNLMRRLGQDGVAEQYKTATVKQSDSWSYSFDHLPAHDLMNNEYFYWVEETPTTGYETTYDVKDESHCDIVNTLKTYTLTIRYWQHKLGETQMEEAFPDYVATLCYKQPYDVESPEREGITLDDMSQERISGIMPADDLVIDVYYHRIAYRLTIHYIYQDGTTAHEDFTWTYWFDSTYNVPSPIIPGFTPSIDLIAGKMPAHGLEFTVVYVGDGEIVVPDEDATLGFKTYPNAGECFE